MLSRLSYGLSYAGFYSFITLTSTRNDPIEILEAWSILRKRIKRRYGFEFLWVLVKSPKKTHRWHVHMIARTQYIEQRWLSQQWNEIHHSPIVDIRAVTDDTIQAELFKNTKLTNYMLQGAKESGTAFRWGMSQKWIPLKSWRTDMHIMVMNRGYNWFVSDDGKKAYQSVLAGTSKAHEYLWQYDYIKKYIMYSRWSKMLYWGLLLHAKSYNPTDVMRTVIWQK